VAKTVAARAGLIAQFQAHSMERAYVAIAVGQLPDSLVIDSLHGRHPTDRKRFSGRVTRGKRAVTHVRVLERLHEASLVECRLETGRTHQIRMHLSEAGHALLGDPLYGPARAPRDLLLQAAAQDLGRQALHAKLLGFDHPCTGAHLRFEAEVPDDFARAVAQLRKASV
jgi:23S rRNA pseudouridine1911/1915/1917 synthase